MSVTNSNNGPILSDKFLKLGFDEIAAQSLAISDTPNVPKV